MGYSLEELILEFELVDGDKEIDMPEQSFVMKGFAVQGAEFDKDTNKIILSQSLGGSLPNCIFRWVRKDPEAKDNKDETIQIPVYLNMMRRHLLTSVQITTQGIPQYVWYQRGVAFFAWNAE